MSDLPERWRDLAAAAVVSPPARRTALITIAWMVVASAALMTIYLLGHRAGVPPRIFWDDPSALTGRPVYLGAVTVAGVVLWGVAGTTALMAARFAAGRDGGGPTRSLRAVGVICLYLMVDDQLLLHEDVLPKFGLAETAVLLAYGLIAIVLALRYGRDLLSMAHISALLLGIVLLGLSIALDIVKPPIPARNSLEESIKFLGLVGLAVFGVRTAMSEGRRSTL